MQYITKEVARSAIKNMTFFHEDIRGLYGKYNMDILSNLGRRNILLSQVQEKCFANELSKIYDGVLEDGRTGRPDIYIGEIEKELECKLTSRHASGAFSLQSDYETLSAKGPLDYLYVLASKEFDKFSVLFFEGLTIDDFRPLSNGARGKVSMYKHRGMKKCNVLMGSVEDFNHTNLQRIKKALKTTNPATKKYQKLLKSREYWKTQDTKYKFHLESVK